MARLWRAFNTALGSLALSAGFPLKENESICRAELDWCGKPDMTPYMSGCDKGRFLGVELG